ncbi:MAG TPA: sugar phosphate isomerase/epimerase family protein [Caldilineaceae bacterium]|nr:sugar phosphate isomerase/epimerase family protein [Caldilineaceae bacterium]
MLKNFNAGMIGVKASLVQSIDYARRHGFRSVDFSITEAVTLADEIGIDGVRALFEDADIFPGSWGFPINFRQDETTWRDGLMALPRHAEFALELGCTRTATWIMPGHDELSFQENFAFHTDRLRPAAQILADYGCRLGLEFIGPKTLRSSRKYNFIHTMDGMLALAAAMGTGNVGLLLDLFHLYTSHGSLDDVRKLHRDDIVVVHINDAIAGRAPDEQIDNERALPGETGVMDIAGFLQTLRDIYYEGPITTEPFSQRVRDMEDEAAVRATSAAMDAVWQQAGLL